MDPERPEVKQAVAVAQLAGIRIKVKAVCCIICSIKPVTEAH